MAIPATPVNFNVQQANGQVLLTWNISVGSTSYTVQRSTDNVTFTFLASVPLGTSSIDTTVTVGTQYWYQVASVSADGTSAYTTSQSAIPTLTGDLSLGQIRLMSQQRADRVNSNFVTMPEWNTYIQQSYFELYDLLTTTYEDYYLQTPYVFQTDGNFQYTLPTDFYKLLGVDAGLANNNNAWATLKRFEFEDRNQYVFPQLTTTLLGLYDLRYKIMGSTIYFIPTPATASYIRVWYIPKLTQLLQDTDILKGISGWTEYVICDAAIKALQKEESDVSVLVLQKQALMKRIEETAMNRDAGSPACVSDTRRVQTYNGAPWGGSWAGM